MPAYELDFVHGRFITLFEKAFASYCGVDTQSPSAMELPRSICALVALDVSAGDEIIVPSLTYVATANAVSLLQCHSGFRRQRSGHFQHRRPMDRGRNHAPHKRDHPVHLYGHPVDMDPILAIANKASTCSSWRMPPKPSARAYKNRLMGGIGTCATFSFFGNKIITTGEGGMVTTNDDALGRAPPPAQGTGYGPGSAATGFRLSATTTA